MTTGKEHIWAKEWPPTTIGHSSLSAPLLYSHLHSFRPYHRHPCIAGHTRDLHHDDDKKGGIQYQSCWGLWAKQGLSFFAKARARRGGGKSSRIIPIDHISSNCHQKYSSKANEVKCWCRRKSNIRRQSGRPPTRRREKVCSLCQSDMR